MAQSGFKYRTLVTGKIFADMRGKGLSDRAKVLALYILLGNDVGNRIGLFPINFPGIAHANDWPQKTSVERKALEKDFLDVCECFAWQYDEIAEVLFIRSHFKYCPMHHGLQLIGCLKDLSCLPETYLVHVWAENAKTLIKRETNPKPTKENPHPKPTDLHKIFDRIVGPILAKIPKPDGATAPVPEAPAAKPKTEPKVFSKVVERIYASGLMVFIGNNHKPPATPAGVEKEKNQVRLLLETDGETEENIMKGLEFLRLLPDKSHTWDGRGVHCGTFANFRKKWGEHIRAKAIPASAKQPPANSVFEKGLEL